MLTKLHSSHCKFSEWNDSIWKNTRNCRFLTKSIDGVPAGTVQNQRINDESGGRSKQVDSRGRFRIITYSLPSRKCHPWEYLRFLTAENLLFAFADLMKRISAFVASNCNPNNSEKLETILPWIMSPVVNTWHSSDRIPSRFRADHFSKCTEGRL